MTTTNIHDPVQNVLTRLNNVKQRGDNKWQALCPAHEDKKASLSISRGKDGRVLLKCHAGCNVDDICKELGIQKGDLFVSKTTSGQQQNIVATYNYMDENGTLLFQAVRYQPKNFKQRRLNGKGGWINNLKGVRRVLYRLPQLLAADPHDWVFLVEGEKDADRLAQLGLVATTSPMGAGKWRDEYAEFLRDRKVVILPDNDDPGRKHAEDVAQSLSSRAAEVRILELPSLPDKGDVSDWLNAGGTKEKLLELVERAKPYTPTANTTTPRQAIAPNLEVLGIDESRATWLWDRDERRLHKFPKMRDLDRASYIQIGGQWVIDNIDTDQRNSLGMQDVHDQIALRSREKSITWNEVLGQGIWAYPKGDGILIVSGNEAMQFRRHGFEDGGESQVIETPQVGGHLMELDQAQSWAKLSDLIEAAKAMTPERAKEVYDSITNLLASWKFACPHDAELIASLIIATPLQAYWAFRPQVWLTGATNTGKSALQTLLTKVLASPERFDNETTEAALRQTIGHSVLPVLLDEFERWPKRQSIIKLLRSATRGGKVAKGTPGGKAITFSLRHICWVASIETGMDRAADRNRFIIIELLKPQQIKMPDNRETEPLKDKILALGLAVAEPVRSLAAKLGCQRIAGVDERLMEALALPAAIWAVIHQKDEQEAGEYLGSLAAERSEMMKDSSESDEDALMRDILAASIRIDMIDEPGASTRVVYREVAVGQILDDLFATNAIGKATIAEMTIRKKQLETSGIRVLDNNRIFVAPDMVKRNLLKGTRWEQLNIKDVLVRCRGAVKSRQRISGSSIRGVELAFEVAEDDLCETEIEEPPEESMKGVPASGLAGTRVEHRNLLLSN